MSTRIYPFQFVSTHLGTLSVHCQMPKEAAEKLASTLRSTVQLADGRWFYELTGIGTPMPGVQGQEVRKNGPFRLLFGTEEKAKLADEATYVLDLMTFWSSLPNPITPETALAIRQTAEDLFERHCPVVDKTETLDEVQARQATLSAAEASQQVERKKIIAAYAEGPEEITLEKGEMGVVVALVYDNSDMMTDYYHPRSVKHEFFLARMRSQRRQERILREVIARYADLKAVEWSWHGSDKYSHSPDCYLKSKGTFEYQGTPFKAYSGQEVTRVWYEIRFVRSGRYLPYHGFHHPSPEPTPADSSTLDLSAIRIEHERSWTWLYFPEKPPEATLERLDKMGGHWGRKRGGWYFQRHVPDEEFAWLFETREPETEETPAEASAPPAVRDTPTPGPAGYIAGKGSAFEYIPPWMEVPPPYATEKQDDPLAVIKLFTPDSSWSWFILEYDGQDICFGLVAGHDTELGDFSLREMQAAHGPLGLQPERDLWFCPTPVTQLPEYQAKWGTDGPFRGGGGEASAPVSEPKPPDSPSPAIPEALAAPLPDGWTEEDVIFLFDKLAAGPILVGDTRLGLPTIHDFLDAEHLGYGLFRVNGEGFTLQFDGGSAMGRTPSGKGWTRLDVQGDYPYDFEGVSEVLQTYLTPPDPTNREPEVLTEAEARSILDETTTPHNNPAQTLTGKMLAAMEQVSRAVVIADENHNLTFGDNGHQVYFEGENYLLLNPYLERGGRRFGSGWVWFHRNNAGEDWRCLSDPVYGPDSQIGDFSLEKALHYAERAIGQCFALVDAPENFPDRFPILSIWQDGASISDTPNGEPSQPLFTKMLTGLAAEALLEQAARIVPEMSGVDEAPNLLMSADSEASTPPKTTFQPVTSFPPGPEELAEFAQFELALVTGLTHKPNSAFHRALKAITRPDTLRLALQQVNGDARRGELLLRRLHTLEGSSPAH